MAFLVVKGSCAKIWVSVWDVLHRVYLDNFDVIKDVDLKLATLIEGTPPAGPGNLYSRAPASEMQGAILDGDQGVAYPKPEKIVKYWSLAIELLTRKRCH